MSYLQNDSFAEPDSRMTLATAIFVLQRQLNVLDRMILANKLVGKPYNHLTGGAAALTIAIQCMSDEKYRLVNAVDK